MKIYILVSLDKYFGYTANANFAQLTASYGGPQRQYTNIY